MVQVDVLLFGLNRLIIEFKIAFKLISISFLPQPIPPYKEDKYSRKRKTLIDIRPNAQTHINMSILKKQAV